MEGAASDTAQRVEGIGASCACSSVSASGEGVWSTLMEDIDSIRRDAAFQDVVFVCGEQEEEIGVCRALAAARSPVLRSMLLTSGMSECSKTRVSFPGVEPECMRICLEFIYTDSVQDSSWSSVFLAMKVVKAAMYFLLRRLESIAIEYIDKVMDQYTDIDAERFEELIPSYNLGVLLYPVHSAKHRDASMFCNLGQFVSRFRAYAKLTIAGCSKEQLFSGCKRERFFYKCVSEQALAHLIEGPDNMHSLSHYFSFLHVVRWSASRVLVADPSINEDELEGVLNKCFPCSLQLMGSMLSSTTDIECHNDAKVSRFMKLLADPLAHCLQETSVNLAKIPAHILHRFLEPLHVIPASALLQAYRCHALERPDLHWEQPCHGSNYKVDEGSPTVISTRRQGLKGLAKCGMYLNAASIAFFDWEIVVLRPCKEIHVGFCVWQPTLRPPSRKAQVLGVKPGTWALRADGSLRYTTFFSESGSSEYVDAFHDKRVRIQVHLNLAGRSCAFSINGKDAGLAWSDLPIYMNTKVRPAISLGGDGMAKIKPLHPSWMDWPSKRLRTAD